MQIFNLVLSLIFFVAGALVTGCSGSSTTAVSATAAGGSSTSTSLCTCAGTCTCDTFTRADSALTLGDTQGGTIKTYAYPGACVMGIDTNAAYKISSGTQTAATAAVDMGVTTCDVQATLKVVPSSGDVGGIMIRSTDGDNLYAFVADMSGFGASDQYAFIKVVAGSPTAIGTCPTVPTANHVLKVTVSGNSFTATVDGAACVTGASDTDLSGTKFGLMVAGGGARFTNLKIENCL